jgi:predicted regulator of Ras-like GTPase activity (Roadblock/LC7/MglB family)
MLDETGELNWLLDDLVGRVARVRNAMILTGDGLPMGMSQGMTEQDAERLAAVSAGFHGLARSASQRVDGGRIRQTVVELEKAFLFVAEAGEGTCLAVLSESDVNVGLIGYEMMRLVKRVRRHLGTAPRPQSGRTGGA